MTLRTLGLAVLGVSGLAIFPACKNEAPASPPSPPSPGAGTAAPAPTPPAAPVPEPVTSRGTIRGVVKFNGAPPEAAELAPSADPACEGMLLKDQSVLVKDGKLQNVLVRVRGPVPGAAAAVTAPVVVDQQKCSYQPRVQGAVAGQPLQIKNSDGTMHNVRGMLGTKALFNVAQPPSAPPVTKPVPAEVELLQLKCDVHPWMRAYVAVSPHPYFVTTREEGVFALEGVPAGSYTLEAWHETLGTKTAEVTVKEGAPAEVSFDFSAADKG
ncbi:carboxypeptidase regulatory-like domain-containing protein [Stigmatella sp. ncwal1]|uniref:Carboxypeptidase regulatory-like domain-containing protein n=1 Tax=Stigmatella ashevillensis TaxID=2995309 RepID=A0ABT5D6T8_9BACT|nr:carboxypeptidase regulatory-like domain-containing protein [Stigmatella ashevillena]MDC0709379.1 carboxypeptidase regulatory-like domain-containing protein [Stigmatella ashevillena]